jgi:hypothetical protein
VHPQTQEKHTLSLVQAGDMGPEDLKACFDLVEETSKADYEASSGGWKPKKKSAEMKSPELRYIMVKDGQGNVCGFTSLMPTFEEGQPVVYCYEIHLKSEMQGYVAFVVLFHGVASISPGSNAGATHSQSRYWSEHRGCALQTPR